MSAANKGEKLFIRNIMHYSMHNNEPRVTIFNGSWFFRVWSFALLLVGLRNQGLIWNEKHARAKYKSYNLSSSVHAFK